MADAPARGSRHLWAVSYLEAEYRLRRGVRLQERRYIVLESRKACALGETMPADHPFWLNVDTPTKRCVIHRGACGYALAKRETPYKGIGRLKRDGGWLHFAGSDELRALLLNEPRTWKCALNACAGCQPLAGQDSHVTLSVASYAVHLQRMPLLRQALNPHQAPDSSGRQPSRRQRGMIKFQCSGCAKEFGVPDEYAGRRGKCKACGLAMVVPAIDSNSSGDEGNDDMAAQLASPDAGASAESECDFRSVRWGMSQAEVKQNESGEPGYEDPSDLEWTAVVAELPCTLTYMFVADKLVRAGYVFTNEHSHKNGYITDFCNLKKRGTIEEIWRAQE